jgi:hypothetical protein
MASNKVISKRRKFVAVSSANRLAREMRGWLTSCGFCQDGVFFSELSELFETELANEGVLDPFTYIKMLLESDASIQATPAARFELHTPEQKSSSVLHTLKRF